jgi:hypothetical protein
MADGKTFEVGQILAPLNIGSLKLYMLINLKKNM